MMIAYLFCLPPIEDLLEGADMYGFAYIFVFLRGTGSPAGAATMVLLIWVLGLCCLVGMLAATSRQMWSFARDDALPFSAQIVKVIIAPTPILPSLQQLMLRSAPPKDPDSCEHYRYHSRHLHIFVLHLARLNPRFQQHCQSQYRWSLCLILRRRRLASLAKIAGHSPARPTLTYGCSRPRDFTMGALEGSRRIGSGQQRVRLCVPGCHVVLLFLPGRSRRHSPEHELQLSDFWWNRPVCGCLVFCERQEDLQRSDC
jgi:hypothetical protein